MSRYDYLKEQLSGEVRCHDQWDVFVDITGAKKTMVAGAFLYAAYTGVNICYVDFDDYDRKARSPFGFSCWFRKVDNLYEDLHLREWERVQELYQRYDFQSALALIEDLKDEEWPVEWQNGFNHLHNFIRLCLEWENGQYRAAWDTLQPLPDEVKRLAPGAVEVLGPCWPVQHENLLQRGIVDKFLLNSRALIVYAQDELARCRRLTDLPGVKETRQDARSAFTRAYSVHETLLKARVASLYTHKELIYQPNQGEAINFTDLCENEYQNIWKELGKCQAIPALDMLNGDKPYKLRERRSVMCGKKNKIGLPDKIDLYALCDYRNSVIHTYASTLPGKDCEAIKVAEANLDDYIRYWSSGGGADCKLPSGCLAIPSWDELKRACGADFLADVRGARP